MFGKQNASFSNPWKNWIERFQTLETDNLAGFSFFQALEKMGRKFPTLGKRTF